MVAVDRTWSNVPDPRVASCPAGGHCTVVLLDLRWSHLHKHANDRTQPWTEWLPAPVVALLRSNVPAGTTDQQLQAARQQASDQFEQEAKQALGVPLAVLYDVAQPVQGTRSFSPWELTADIVLRSGAKLTIRETRDKQLMFLTCFFVDSVRFAPPVRRWRLLVRELLDRYAQSNADGSYSLADPATWPRRNETTQEMIHQPRFRNHASWGLDPKRNQPWNTMPSPWPAPASAPPVVRFRPRPAY
jgi:hypothetical protein